MKRSTVTAIIIAVLLIATFAVIKFYRNTDSPSFSILGEWRVDSVYAPTTAPDITKQLTTAIAEGSDSGKMVFHFLPDSVLSRTSFHEKLTEKYYLKDSVLYINEGAGFTAFSFSALSDSLVKFHNTDSVVFVLRRK